MFEKDFLIWKTLWTYQKRFLGKKKYFKTARTKNCRKISKNGVPRADLAKGV